MLKTDLEPGGVSGTSTGVVVRKYWNRLSQLQGYIKQVMQDVSKEEISENN